MRADPANVVARGQLGRHLRREGALRRGDRPVHADPRHRQGAATGVPRPRPSARVQGRPARRRRRLPEGRRPLHRRRDGRRRRRPRTRLLRPRVRRAEAGQAAGGRRPAAEGPGHQAHGRRHDEPARRRLREGGPAGQGDRAARAGDPVRAGRVGRAVPGPLRRLHRQGRDRARRVGGRHGPGPDRRHRGCRRRVSRPSQTARPASMPASRSASSPRRRATPPPPPTGTAARWSSTPRTAPRSSA